MFISTTEIKVNLKKMYVTLISTNLFNRKLYEMVRFSIVMVLKTETLGCVMMLPSYYHVKLKTFSSFTQFSN